MKRLTRQARSYLQGIRVGDDFIKGEKASYLDGGEGEVIVLLHGYCGMKSHMRMLMTPLTKRYRVIAPEIPGLSIRGNMNNPARFSIRFLAEYLNELLEKLGVSRFHIMGCSAGAVLATSFAIRYPNKVLTLTLLGMPTLYRDTSDPLTDPKQASDFYVPTTLEGVDRLSEFLYLMPPQIPIGMKRKFLETSNKNRDFLVKVLEEFFTNAFQLVPRLGHITTPTLFIYGDHDRVTPQQSIDLLLQRIKGIQSFRLENSGHVSYIENPAEVAMRFHSFVKYAKSVKEKSKGSLS